MAVEAPQIDYLLCSGGGDRDRIEIDIGAGWIEHIPPRQHIAARLCRQVLSGIDLIQRAGGEYAILEANSAPVYLDIERKTNAPITDAILDYLFATRPKREAAGKKRRTRKRKP